VATTTPQKPSLRSKLASRLKRQNRSGDKKSPGSKFQLRRLKPRSPRYFRESFAELKKVTWPTRRESWRLTIAVFVFSVVFAAVIVAADIGYKQLAERLFL